MDDKLYLVTCDGHTGRYGSEIYLVGIFTSMEQANAAADQVNSDINTALRNKYGDMNNLNWCRVTLVGTGIVYPVRPGSWCDVFENDKYMGGYVE